MSAIVNGFVNVDVTVANFEIEAALRISANPGFVLYRGALTAEIGKGYQITSFAFLTLGEIVQRSHLRL